MAEFPEFPPPPAGPARPGRAALVRAALAGRALAVTLAILVAGAAAGVPGGLIWSAIAPRPLFQVASHGVAYVVNPETNAFIAGDGWFAVVAVAGGALIGLAGYLLGVRRFGPLPVLGVLGGATVAAFLARWTGEQIGLASFRHLLAASKSGRLIRQPVDLGSRGVLAFWPLAAGAVIGAIELVIVLRERQQGTAPALTPAAGSFGLRRRRRGLDDGS